MFRQKAMVNKSFYCDDTLSKLDVGALLKHLVRWPSSKGFDICPQALMNASGGRVPFSSTRLVFAV